MESEKLEGLKNQSSSKRVLKIKEEAQPFLLTFFHSLFTLSLSLEIK